MEVKIYREPENESLILNDDELKVYNDLIKDIGIESNLPSTESKPSVYLCLNKPMTISLTAICPVKVSVEKYTRSTIPVEVLKVLKYCKDSNMFDIYEIWYADKNPDPLLIGKKYRSDHDRVNKYHWNSELYLIARWGDCSMEIDQLMSKGFELIKQSILDFASESKCTIDSILSNPDMHTRNILNGKTLNLQFHIGNANIFF